MADCPATVWLVDETTSLAVDERQGDTERIGDSVLVPSPAGSRLTKVPGQSTLGRRARAERVRRLRDEIVRLDIDLRNLIAGQRQVADSIAMASSLLADSALLERSDPALDLSEARQRHDSAAKAECEYLESANDLITRARELVTRREALRGILSDAQLLDPPDYRDTIRDLELQQAKARAAQDRLNAVAGHVAIVEDGIDVLRVPPPNDDELESYRDQLATVRTARDRMSGVLDALRYVETHITALEWSDAPRALAAEQALRPALDEQLRLAEAALQRSEEADDAAERSLERAIEEAQKALAAVQQLDAALARDREELAATKVEDPSDEALVRAQRHHEELRKQSSVLDSRERALGNEAVEAKVRHEGQAEKVESLRKERDDEEGQWRPIAERWRKLQEEATNAGVLRSAMTSANIERTRSAGSVNLYQEARTKGEVLAERLGRSEGGKEGAEAISAWLAQASQDVGLAYLSAWIDAREWLRRRVPPQIAEVDDPLETLARVREHLGRLRERLTQQEKNLRGQSEDVARNIETQRRKARREVNRLNQELRSVHFGSIHGVQIQVRPVESRERVLRALREGEAQQLLFQSEMPIEEAMAELFKRYGGGQTGGQRLLDYREYLDLQVEVRRQESPQWERANPTRMSTGEAIGVGAAIMMVVLTAWERHANLLRAKRSAGTLRLLFLDEANRLSQDNLAVLFELCQNLELQLLIASPEVAQSEGNTTYHLVRQVDESGQEVVRVTGRRTLRGG
jgi:chromosome partition protein MukB